MGLRWLYEPADLRLKQVRNGGRPQPRIGLDGHGRPPVRSRMSRIHFIGGEKGGVGKTVVARVLAQWFVDRSIPFAAVDGELSQGALIRYYGDFTQSADLAASESADQIMDRALGAERRVLVDLPAQSARGLHAWFTGANVLEFAKETGIAVTFWHVTDGGFASLSELDRGLQLFGRDARHIVVKNYGRTKNFGAFDASDAKRTLEAIPGRTVDIPELDATAMYKVDRAGCSFWAAIHRTEGEGVLSPLDRQRVKLWLAQCYANLDAL